MIYALAAVAALLVLAAPAQAQMPCESQLATAGGTAWTCPLGGIRNVVDIEGGTAAYLPDGQLDRPKLDLNISSGEHDGARSRIALNPDTGGPGTVIFDGRKNKIASFYPGSIEFFAPVQIQGLDVQQTLLGLQVKAQTIALRIDRLQRRMARLRGLLRVERARRIQADRRVARRP